MTRSTAYAPLMRLAIALGLAAAIIVAALVSGAHAAPGCTYDNNGRTICSGTATATHRTARLGQGRPAGCPRLWCGCFARLQEGIRDPAFNRALAWLRFRHVPKQIGAWAVMRRKGGGHVGRVVAIDAAGNPVLLSGNHGGRVGTATYRAGRVLAYVRP